MVLVTVRVGGRISSMWKDLRGEGKGAFWIRPPLRSGEKGGILLLQVALLREGRGNELDPGPPPGKEGRRDARGEEKKKEDYHIY